MKTSLLFSLLLASASLSHANPEIATIISQEYGVATSVGILLLQSPPTAVDPVQWAVYARDPFRPGELVRVALSAGPSGWAPQPAGGGKLLTRVPASELDFSRIKFRSSDALKVAQQSAMLAKVNFVTASYQLAANATTGAPEWGLSLDGPEGNEIGFIVISAETGAVVHQQWGSELAGNAPASPSPPRSKGEKAADDVKRAARNAWEWTGDTGLEVGDFFKRLFKGGK
ncbi:MAG: hypothetical protein B7Z37_27850 [Verrucomicrobia bacterium 12-59-8]|nr:MAG: hypothetical protein B7Z37_27850 [Verrucomicrobia bacterium 12-59-8]